MFTASRTPLALLALCALATAPAAQHIITDGARISDTDPATADLFVEDYSVLDGQVCIGNGCSDVVLPDTNTLLLLKSSTPTIDFEDTSTNPGFPARDWQLRVNDPGSGGQDRFSIRDRTEGTIPFTIEGGAPENSLFIDHRGYVGIGTMFPSESIHIVDDALPAIAFTTPLNGGGDIRWELEVAPSDVHLYAYNSATFAAVYPFRVYTDTISNTLVLNDRHVGIGASPPQAGLHVKRQTDDQVALLVEEETGSFGTGPDTFAHFRSDQGNAQIKVEELDPTANPRTLLNLQNNGRPEIVMGNTATNGEWSFGAGTDFFLKVGTVGSASGAKTKVLTAKGNGDVIVAGTLTTSGTTCGGGCDAVFSENYDLPSIRDHADRMFALGHLPNVGPTVENAPINISDKLGRVLNELEHAHIYIARLEADDTALRAELAAMRAAQAALLARLAAVEARD